MFIDKKPLRNNWPSIILALLLERPMCGLDIVAEIHTEFATLMSHGTIYPALYKLEKDGLLKTSKVPRAGKVHPNKIIQVKMYSIIDREEVISKLKKHITAKRLLIKFLHRRCANG